MINFGRVLRWVGGIVAARRQTLQSYDSDTGHDQGRMGYNAFKVLGDRLAVRR